MTRNRELPAGAEGASLDAMVVYNIMRAHAAISPSIDGSLRDLKLTGAQFNVLILLQASPDGLPLGELGRRLVVTKPNVTGLIDRLEQKGLVERAVSADRRVTLARITPAGRRLTDDIAPRHAALLCRLVSGLTAAEKQTLSALLTRLRRGIRRQFGKG